MYYVYLVSKYHIPTLPSVFLMIIIKDTINAVSVIVTSVMAWYLRQLSVDIFSLGEEYIQAELVVLILRVAKMC